LGVGVPGSLVGNSSRRPKSTPWIILPRRLRSPRWSSWPPSSTNHHRWSTIPGRSVCCRWVVESPPG